MSPNSNDVQCPSSISTKVIRTKNFKFKLHLIWNGFPRHLQKMLFKNCREHTYFRVYGRFSKVIHILIYNTSLHKCIITEIWNKTKTHQTWSNTYEDVHKHTYSEVSVKPHTLKQYRGKLRRNISSYRYGQNISEYKSKSPGKSKYWQMRLH